MSERAERAGDGGREFAPPGVVEHRLPLPAGMWGRPVWSLDETRVAVASGNLILVFDVPAERLLCRIAAFHNRIGGLALSADGTYVAAIGAATGLKVFHAATGEVIDTVRTEQGRAVAFSPVEHTLATGHGDGPRLWHLTPDGLSPAAEFPRSGVRLPVSDLAFDRTGEVLFAGSPGYPYATWSVRSRTMIQEVDLDYLLVNTATITPDGRFLVTGHADRTIRFSDAASGALHSTLEGHTDEVVRLAYIADGQYLASEAANGEVRVWHGGTLETVATANRLAERPSLGWTTATLFGGRRMASVEDGNVITIRRLDLPQITDPAVSPHVEYATVKIVLLGEAGVGKTGLGWRLVHGDFKEHASTHGQQFWLLDQLGGVRDDGAECEAILWDLAGQPDYRLTHALFLDDADLALVLFDPTRGDDPLQGADYWLRQFGAAEPERRGNALLVAARSDRGSARLPQDEVERFSAQRGARIMIATSALTGQGIDELTDELRRAIDWDQRPTTITTETFKRIKDHVLALKQPGISDRVILSPAELRAQLESAARTGRFTDEEMLGAVGHLAHHGYVSTLRTSAGEPRILLAPDLLNNVASSIVLEARRNPRGLGSLHERKVLAGEYPFPELDRLRPGEQEVLLDSAVALFLQHNVCFRETDPLTSTAYLVFPELINLRKPTVDDDVEDGPSYSVSGAVENVYASLVVLLGYTGTFTRRSQWRNQARYVVGEGLVCGFRLEGTDGTGELTFVLYFGRNVGQPIRNLFRSLFESFLARRRLTVERLDPVTCALGHEVHRIVVRDLLAEGKDWLFCSRCGDRVALVREATHLHLDTSAALAVEVQHRAAGLRSRFERAAFLLKRYATQESDGGPTCFISYAWGNEANEKWVEDRLAVDLVKAGVKVILDRWENSRIGSSVPRFLEQVAGAHRVIVVGTPEYLQKYENKDPSQGFAVAAEGDLIGNRLMGTEADKLTVLPLLLSGTRSTSLPPLLRGRTYGDFRVPDFYFVNVLDVLMAVYDLPEDHPLSVELTAILRE